MPRIHLRWFRFSLRAFLLTITVFAIWVALQANRANSQRRAVETLAEYGYVIYEHEFVSAKVLPGIYLGVGKSKRVDWGREAPGPRWLRHILDARG